MDNVGRQIINRYQGDFPLLRRPFVAIAEELKTDESSVIDCIKGLLSTKMLSRFGPLYNAACLGGGLTLAAVSVPEKDFSAVSAQINSLPQVAHNYRREHQLNMWFVLATEKPEAIESSLKTIEQLTGLKIFNFPKVQEYYIGLRVQLDSNGGITTRSFDNYQLQSGYKTDDLDRHIIRATQSGLPLISEPYSEIAQQAQCREDTVISRMQIMIDYGVIRRIGAIPNHYRLGLTSNGMSVWDVSSERVDELGRIIGQLDFVSHCYQRPRYENVWPYNLFAMVHGRTRDEVIKKVALISDLLGDYCRQSDVLFSSAILKKSGLRLVA